MVAELSGPLLQERRLMPEFALGRSSPTSRYGSAVGLVGRSALDVHDPVMDPRLAVRFEAACESSR